MERRGRHFATGVKQVQEKGVKMASFISAETKNEAGEKGVEVARRGREKKKKSLGRERSTRQTGEQQALTKKR